MVNTPIIFIPGLMGTYLYTEGLSPSRYWWTGVKKRFMKLELTKDGFNLADISFNTKGIIKQIGLKSLPFKKFYAPIVDFFTKRPGGYTENVDFFTFPYDWRKSVSTQSATQLGTKIDEIIEHSVNGKVIIIAHSMGGVVASTLLSQDPNKRIRQIDKIFYVGTPFYGSPKMICPILFGKESPLNNGFLKLIGLHPKWREVKITVRNMEGLYSLLPYQYYSSEGGEYYRDSVDGINTSAYKNEKLGINQTMLETVEEAANLRIETLTSIQNGKRRFIPGLREKSYFVYGNGLNTILNVFSKNAQFDKICPPAKKKGGNGDGTVPSYGLTDLVGGDNGGNAYPVDKGEHTKIVQKQAVFNWIKSKIEND